MIPDLLRFVTSGLHRFKIPDLHKFATSRLVGSRFQTFTSSRLQGFAGSRFQTFTESITLKAHFMNFVKLNVSRGHVFPEFPNSEHE
jgi:hypothetical protein